MNKNKLITIGIVMAILLVAGGIIYFKNFTGAITLDIPSEEVAKWIGEHSVLYFSPTCSHCIDQENLFGKNVKYLNMVDSTIPENLQKYEDVGGDGHIPMWRINNQNYYGVQSVEKLKELTGYQD
jgi:hypothetical protein